MTRPLIIRIALAVIATLVAVAGLLAYNLDGSGILGPFVSRDHDHTAKPATLGITAGESVVARQPANAAQQTHTAEQATATDPSAAAEPNLHGLTEIPLEPWVPEKRRVLDGSSTQSLGQQTEELPWDAVEPVPLAPQERTTSSEPKVELGTLMKPSIRELSPAVLPSARLPESAEVRRWIRAKRVEIKGEDRARPLYHFELWLELPLELTGSLVAVSYDFNTPAVMPRSQRATNKEANFRVSVGGLTCPDQITVTLNFASGRSSRIVLDGCEILGGDKPEAPSEEKR